MKSVAAVVILILCAGATASGQRERGDWWHNRNQPDESKYSYSTIVKCYAATDSLPAFTRCLERHEPTGPDPLPPWERHLEREERERRLMRERDSYGFRRPDRHTLRDERE
jgi:hypothetical protein